MEMRQKVLLSWSGGKDAALALYQLHRSEEHQVTGLLTTVTREYDRISMHGVRRVLLERQAKSVGLPLETVLISKSNSEEQYERAMRAVLEKQLAAGVTAVAFGDILLEDVRRYREDKLSSIGMEAVFPLRDRDTTELSHSFLRLGFEAVVTCVDSEALDPAFVGRDFDLQFLTDLPAGVDPCGENGEFHTFVYAGPVLHDTIPLARGKVVLRDNRFYYCDLIPI
jgi:uncharacterized protein (TIGR00290 family)